MISIMKPRRGEQIAFNLYAENLSRFNCMQ